MKMINIIKIEMKDDLVYHDGMSVSQIYFVCCS
jgi:hypothetical protein